MTTSPSARAPSKTFAWRSEAGKESSTAIFDSTTCPPGASSAMAQAKIKPITKTRCRSIDDCALFVPPFQVLQIDTEANGNQKIQKSAEQSPTIVGVEVVS